MARHIFDQQPYQTMFKSRSVTTCYGLYREALPERGTFLRLQVNKKVGISLVQVYERVREYVISVYKKAQKD